MPSIGRPRVGPDKRDKSFKAAFARRLDELMTAAGVSREDMSAATGVTTDGVGRWLRGQGFPRPELWPAIAAACKVQRIADLLPEGFDPPAPKTGS